MLLIWGFKARLKVLAEGLFICPNEGGQRGYRHVSARRWFTFFWIPVIPLKELGEYVQCGSCGAQYNAAVAQMQTRPQGY